MAFVTSAIREAPNGEDVLARVRAETRRRRCRCSPARTRRG